ncbi:pentapeptide repeat-containing protein [Acidicapsa acidisoli]|uniref:pentapeptide repeat-containing protein n=1 Tax=Acidicapsa acidisoli TaxID=1615681 RepID=UPI0021E007AA|nr:pentapeptide repeat-containing protein [Acidicapsa acidisoli]
MTVDISSLRDYATKLLSEAKNHTDFDQVASFIKTLDEIEGERANTIKILEEEKEIQRNREKENRGVWRDLVSSVTPLLTTLVLACTLVFQTYSFRKSEQDKAVDMQRQVEAEEKTRWTEALKLISESEKLSPAEALLQSFTTPAYKELAHQEMLKLLTQKANDPASFEDIFKSTFEPISWDSIPEIVALNIHLGSQADILLNKGQDKKRDIFIESKLSDGDRTALNNLSNEITYTCTEILPLLKSTHDAHLNLNLASVSFSSCDLTGVNLNGADITSVNLSNNVVDRADFSGITKFEGANFSWCAWWRAHRISPQLLKYLTEYYTFNPKGEGWLNTNPKPTKAEYDASLKRLVSQTQQ